VTVERRREPPSDPDEFQLVDVAQLKNWIRFVLHSVGRRKGLAILVALLTLGGTAALLAVLPRTYHVDAQLLAQRNTVMPALGNPGRTVPTDAESPTRAAAETVLRRDNLLSLMKQTDLLNRWERGRSSALRFKDYLTALVAPPTDEDRINAMVGFLEKRLTVTTGESTVTIAIDWPDAQLGYALVDNALQNFLEQRHSAEVSSIAETIAILESHAADLREQIDSTMEDIKRDSTPTRPTKADAPPPLPRRDPAAEAARAQAAEVKTMLEAKRRAINELDEFRRRRLAELQTELTQKRAIYADAHPAVAQVLQSISALSEDSPQLAALRKDERELQADYERLSARKSDSSGGGTVRAGEVAPRKRSSDAPEQDVQGEYSRTRLRFAMEKYDTLLDRINSARIELDTARAAFKYRYSVIRPPQLPKRPEKPKVPLVIAAGVLAAMTLAVLAAALSDLRSGRILEPWQVERALELEVLGQVPRP
jgi:uncharacterized protein involved in exopolysaccharide biosynthesis